MTLVLELPKELETELSAAARARGVAVELVAVERLLSPLNGAALSPLGAALQKIRANPIRSRGPVDAVADLEEVRAARMSDLDR